jgi:CDP-glycerol glycerophosphotransferase
VIVPIYDVERYLGECLDSVLAQTFTDFEVLLVDDGATDGSTDIAERYVHADPRVRLLRQRNAGLGAARNTGIREARGEFLAFVDSDDTLPPDAYADMMRTIERTGSDMVVGTLKRHGGRGVGPLSGPGPLMRQNHRSRREGVTLADVPLMLADVFAVNKLYRRSFWDEANLAFPVDTRYEDQPTLTQAFLAAKRFDVIPETVYFWRRRDDHSSITQHRGDIADLKDRITTKRISTEAVTQSAPPAARDLWFAAILPIDMWEYFRAALYASDPYWQNLRDAMAEFWNDGTLPFEFVLVPVQQRLMGWLVAAGRRDGLAEVISFVDDCAGDLPVEIRGDTVVCLLPGVDDDAYGAPASVYVLGAHELRWDARLISGRWRGASLFLSGFALIRNVATRGRTTAMRFVATGPNGARAEFTALRSPHPRASRFVAKASQNYDDCGFAVEVDVARLIALSPSLTHGNAAWHFVMGRTVAGVGGQGGFTSVHPAAVDRSWHPVLPTVEARLTERDADVVLELRERP